MRVESYFGKEILPLIPGLAKLRIKVFNDFPYLYEGSLDYEEEYLKIYGGHEHCVLVAAFDGARLVGAATGMPLIHEADYVKKPFIDAGMKIDEIFYFGESVLLMEFRGMGLGHKFFDEREAAAKKFGYKYIYFCGVVRDPNHPLTPHLYSPLDPFWTKRGYLRQDHLKSEFSWMDIGDSVVSKKPMVYWMKKC